MDFSESRVMCRDLDQEEKKRKEKEKEWKKAEWSNWNDYGVVGGLTGPMGPVWKTRQWISYRHILYFCSQLFHLGHFVGRIHLKKGQALSKNERKCHGLLLNLLFCWKTKITTRLAIAVAKLLWWLFNNSSILCQIALSWFWSLGEALAKNIATANLISWRTISIQRRLFVQRRS